MNSSSLKCYPSKGTIFSLVHLYGKKIIVLSCYILNFVNKNFVEICFLYLYRYLHGILNFPLGPQSPKYLLSALYRKKSTNPWLREMWLRTNHFPVTTSTAVLVLFLKGILFLTARKIGNRAHYLL